MISYLLLQWNVQVRQMQYRKQCCHYYIVIAMKLKYVLYTKTVKFRLVFFTPPSQDILMSSNENLESDSPTCVSH